MNEQASRRSGGISVETAHIFPVKLHAYQRAAVVIRVELNRAVILVHVKLAKVGNISKETILTLIF